MRYIPTLAIISAALLLEGCGTTKIIALHCQAKMIIGEHMSCIYHADNLFCASHLITAEDIDKLQIMNKVVSVVHSGEKESDMKQGGAFSTNFPRKPKEYSLWNCSNTGIADPAVKCVLLREADQKLVANQEQQVKLNQAMKRSSSLALPNRMSSTNAAHPLNKSTTLFPTRSTSALCRPGRTWRFISRPLQNPFS